MYGCNDELYTFDNTATPGGEIELRAQIDQKADTRADEAGFADGDRMGLIAVCYKSGVAGELSLSGSFTGNAAMTFHADENKWTSAPNLYWQDDSTPVDFYAYYPFDNSLNETSSYSFDVSADQSVKGGDGTMGAYEASDFLWGVTQRATPGSRVNISLSHRMAGIKVLLEAGEGLTATELSKLDPLVTVDNTSRSCEINLSSGSVKAIGSPDKNIRMNAEEDCWRAVAVPQTVADGMAVISVTLDGKTYTYRRSGGMKYTSGKLHTFTLRIDKRADSGEYSLTLSNQEITDWEADNSSHDFASNTYFVVDVAKAGTLGSAIASLGADATELRNLKVTGTIDWKDFRFMKEEMPKLASLNLREVSVVDAVTYYENGWPIEESVVSDCIPQYALNDKESLRRIILPESITRLGGNSLAHLHLTSTLVIPESVRTIDGGAFDGISEEATIELPSRLEVIGGGAFYGCQAHINLKLPPTIRHIGEWAFYEARNVTGTFSLPPALEYLGGYAFHQCGNMLSGDIVIPQGITVIPDNCFSGMNFANGTNVTIHSGVTKIDKEAFMWETINNDLVIPDNVKYIADGAFCWVKFRSGVRLPSNPVYLGNGAFGYSNMKGDLDYPASIDLMTGGHFSYFDTGGAFAGTKITSMTIGDNVLQIDNNALRDCSELKMLRIGKNVEFIGDEAFCNNHQLQTVICLAKNPPQMGNNVFEGIYPDKCILEVPEASVEAYRADSKWRVFQNITPHRELAFNISEIQCLEKRATREGIIRSEGAWRVKSCPSWVHVTPDHADYKEDLTVTVDALPPGAPAREGEIVFALENSNYTTYTSVRQLRAEHPEDTEIVLQTASAGAREVPVFIVGEGFTADNIVSGEYMRRVNETMEHLFAIEPYKSLRKYFTVTTAIACSTDEGTGDVATIRQNCFDTDGLSPNSWKLREYVEKVSSHAGRDLGNALIIMIANRECFDGWSQIDYDGCSMAAVGHVDDVYPYDQRGLVQRFAGGEAFAGLGNEAIHHFEHIRGCTCPGCNALGRFHDMKNRGYFANLTLSSKMADAPWKDFIFHPDYSADVDMWEGGYGHLRGVWRPESASVMSTYIAYYNVISRYEIYKGVMRRAGKTATLDDFINFDKSTR